MSRYVVMTSQEKTALKTAVTKYIKTTKYGTWANFVRMTREDFRPIEIKGDLWILPLSLKDNPRFSKIKEWVLAKGITIRTVEENEFIEYEL